MAAGSLSAEDASALGLPVSTASRANGLLPATGILQWAKPQGGEPSLSVLSRGRALGTEKVLSG